jgi:general L-amino acid transport system substrate-binding protein
MAFAARPALAGPTLDAVRHAGVLGCGVIGEPGDFTKDDTHGDTTAFGSDICRALGAAVLGDASHARIDGFPDAASGYKALQAGKIDVLVGVTPVPGLAKRYGAAYAQPVFFDGQGFLVNKRSGIATLADLRGRSICYIADTDAERTAHAVLDPKGLAFKPFPFEEMGEMEAALVSGHCEAETHDLSTLASGRSRFHGRIADYLLLADTITLDPLVPAVRAGDSEWVQIVDWVGYALVQAEISGVTRANAAAMSKSEDLTVATLLGGRRGMGYSLGLANDWGLKAIEAVGNYGEIYERDLGHGSSYGLPRGLNRPWTQGGLMWAPPFR